MHHSHGSKISMQKASCTFLAAYATAQYLSVVQGQIFPSSTLLLHHCWLPKHGCGIALTLTVLQLAQLHAESRSNSSNVTNEL